MAIRRYEDDDYEMVKEWYEARGKRPPSPDTMSDMGYIADERVAGWLYTTNSNVAMIEGIIADPHTIPSHRHQSLRLLLGFMIDTALLLGYPHIFGITSHPSMVKTCKQLGFSHNNMDVMILSEKEEY